MQHACKISEVIELLKQHENDDCRFNLSMQHPFQLSLSVF